MAELHKITDEAGRRGSSRRASGSRSDRTRNGCVVSVAPFFCDYAYRYLLSDPALGKTVDERKTAAQERRPDHQDHHRPALPGRGADDAVTAHVNPTDQAIGALAMVEPGTGNVRAISQSRPMGRNKEARPDLPELRRPQRPRRLRRVPGRVDVQAVRARRALEQGIPPYDRDPAPDQIVLNQRQSFPDDLATAPTRPALPGRQLDQCPAGAAHVHRHAATR